EQDVSARRALLWCLGEFADYRLTVDRRQALAVQLRETYRSDPDPGMHSTVDWLLRQRWGLADELGQFDLKLAGRQPGPRRWFVNGQGQTLAVFSSAGDFQMGSSEHEQNRGDTETLHQRRVPRSFALATKEVTVEQFRRFLKDNLDIASRWGRSLD